MPVHLSAEPGSPVTFQRGQGGRGEQQSSDNKVERQRRPLEDPLPRPYSAPRDNIVTSIEGLRPRARLTSSWTDYAAAVV